MKNIPRVKVTDEAKKIIAVFSAILGTRHWMTEWRGVKDTFNSEEKSDNVN